MSYPDHRTAPGFHERSQPFEDIPTDIDTLRTYLICSQDEPRAWVWQRQSTGAWPEAPAELAGREDKIALGGLGVELSMAAIFRGIPDAPTIE